MRKFLIGVGNETMGDDGIGPRVVDALTTEARTLGYDAVVIGHDSVGILAYFEDTTDRIVFVDCVRMGKQPGDWASFAPADVETHKTLGRLTTHEGDLLRIVQLAGQIGCPIPPITILGIEPQSIEPSLALSPALESRFEEYLAAARSALR